MTSPQSKRVGTAMRRALLYVSCNPGCPKRHAALAAYDLPSNRWGYKTVDRCVSRGLLRAVQISASLYQVYITEEGRRAI